MVTEHEAERIGPPSFITTFKAQQNVRHVHPSLHRQQDASELQLAVKSPQILAERLWDLCCIGITRQKNPSISLTEKKHFQSQCVLLFQTVLCGSHDSMAPYILCLRVSVWVANEDERGAYQGRAPGAKVEGITESLTQKAQCKGKKKNVPNKRI